jgi:hypothetical protein
MNKILTCIEIINKMEDPKNPYTLQHLGTKTLMIAENMKVEPIYHFIGNFSHEKVFKNPISTGPLPTDKID